MYMHKIPARRTESASCRKICRGQSEAFGTKLGNKQWIESKQHHIIGKVLGKDLGTQIHRVVYKVHSRRGIYGWNPHQASPANVETSW
jgi:hypothetical protein